MEKILFDYLANYITLTEGEQQIIKELALIRTYQKGTLLLKEGQTSDETYFVLKGCVRCYYLIDGEEKTTELYTELEVVTPVCVTDGKPSEYYVSCVEDAVLLVSDPRIEAESFEKFPRFRDLCLILAEKLSAQKQAAFNAFKTSSPEMRYISLLENRPDLFQRVPQYQLASYLGITPQSLSRMRKRMVRKA